MKQPRIEKKPAFRVIGYKKTTSTVNKANLSDIPRFWAELSHAEQTTLSRFVDSEMTGMIGLSSNEKDGQFDYWLAIATTKSESENLSLLEVSEADYAVFQVTGPLPQALEQAWCEIYQDWLPVSGFQLTPAPQIEWTPAGNTQSADYECEIWLAIEASDASHGAWQSIIKEYQN
ncbi:MAG: GyrI-like domain-containing protein [Streptococcaceae bacterium]|jgi:AraC family transcriptional regulator|nr:GyrI-like domain-containing protein [Streptococcaceae bacterium]